MNDSTSSQAPASIVWSDEIRKRPITATALLIASAIVIALFMRSVSNLMTAPSEAGVNEGLLAGTAGFLATAFGALAGLFLRKISNRVEDSMLGFAAGMMLAASSFSLILPGIAAARALTHNGFTAALTVVAGLALGAALMLGMDQFTPHEHANTGPCGPSSSRVERVWLFFMAITLHNLPEGMAMGVSFAQGDLSVGLPLATAISIQDIPEGLAVVMALRSAGIRTRRAVLLAIASGITEPLGAALGLGLAGGFALAYPIGLGLAAGAMLFVVSHEVIPETHRNGHQTPATLGLMAGFALMMVLDTALG